MGPSWEITNSGQTQRLRLKHPAGKPFGGFGREREELLPLSEVGRRLSTIMLTQEQRHVVTDELTRFAGELNLSEEQKGKLRFFLEEKEEIALPISASHFSSCSGVRNVVIASRPGSCAAI
jgi:hypothetical protein